MYFTNLPIIFIIICPERIVKNNRRKFSGNLKARELPKKSSRGFAEASRLINDLPRFESVIA